MESFEPLPYTPYQWPAEEQRLPDRVPGSSQNNVSSPQTLAEMFQNMHATQLKAALDAAFAQCNLLTGKNGSLERTVGALTERLKVAEAHIKALGEASQKTTTAMQTQHVAQMALCRTTIRNYKFACAGFGLSTLMAGALVWRLSGQRHIIR